MIHHANHIRVVRKYVVNVGGHQASSASMVSILTALYFVTLKNNDRVAVKPHASPIFHAMQYLMGRLDLEHMKNFRGFGGIQPYPSRTKDIDDVDFSTGSVGLGVAITSFASLIQDYIAEKDWCVRIYHFQGWLLLWVMRNSMRAIFMNAFKRGGSTMLEMCGGLLITIASH
ncbi:MAG: hypothetical protein ACJZ9G_06145 [Rhodospirillales bacterium]